MNFALRIYDNDKNVTLFTEKKTIDNKEHYPS